ncbi:hypothetical protein INR49_029045 [Caranx melampygus]|nr:hypothetical protein INR49_029045 [Caranx melampygus]
MTRRENNSSYLYPLPLHPSTTVFSSRLFPPHFSLPSPTLSLLTYGNGRKQNTVNARLYLLLAVYKYVNILNLFTFLTYLLYFPPLFFCIVFSTPCAQGYCEHQGTQGECAI